jgi:hypothetical protein
LKDSPSELSIEEAQRIIKLDRPLEETGLSPAAGGYLGHKVSKPSTHVSEVVGLMAAVFILLFTFGTAIAMGIPILTAILGLSAGFRDHCLDQPHHGGSDVSADPGDHDRAGCWHRLRPVHSNPPP